MTDDERDAEIRWLSSLPPDELELVLYRRAAIRRQVRITLGDAFANAAAAYVNLARFRGGYDPRYIRLACGAAIKSVVLYVEAGLTRRAQVLTRFMETIHRRMSRRAGVEGPPPPA